jgi:hypothetical protein
MEIIYVSFNVYKLVFFLCYVLRLVEVLFPQLFRMLYIPLEEMFNTNINQILNIQDVEQMMKHK